jgi:chromosomal replication initiator protein
MPENRAFFENMDLSAETIWGATLAQLRSKLSTETYNLWFAPLRASVRDGDRLILEVPNEFCEIWLTDNYIGLLQEVVETASGLKLRIHFEVGTSEVLAEKVPPQADASQQSLAEPAPEPTKAGQGLRFDPKNTFEAFVVGSNNNFAHAAALAVAQSPGKAYNPLFVYGGVGLGKTHLLHAIGNYVARKKGARVLYMSSEQFTNAYIEAVQNNQFGSFRKKYRQADVLLIDDVQFLMGKERIQEEFFHTFNALHEARKQIVLTCDRPVGKLQNLEKRLVSRFEWGLVTDLQAPDGEMRLAILRKKAVLMGVELPEEIMTFLANRIRSNIRRLEGAFNRVASYRALTNRELSLEVVESLLREVLHEEGHQAISIEAIQKKVAELLIFVSRI